ncbi:MAG: tRNA preQ1(34) S-adenosylmethionine ribosyltransferase-isomerase QueA [Bdellovibrionales bacterium]
MTHNQQHDWRLADFDFALPEDLIAAHPAQPRDHARLLHVKGKTLADRHVYDLPDLLREGDLLVLNNTKVIPARLYGLRGDIKVEVMLNKPQEDNHALWSALARPGKRLKVGQTIKFADNFEAAVVEKCESGEILIRFDVQDSALFERLKQHGHIPLPPYIKRPHGDTKEDRSDYQTVYAAHEGAVAAPTAGLHFTESLFKQLQEKGISTCEVTLHVGTGTFLPVKTERVAAHKMHAEWGEITETTAALINRAHQEGRRVIAVGTTSLRLLESACDNSGIMHPFVGETDIFITPGYRFKAIDAMITNFHLPKSTLFMLVSALAGLDNMHHAYKHAIDSGYRFYSYGDANLLERDET